MIIEDTLGRLLLTAIVMSDDRFFVGAGIGANRIQFDSFRYRILAVALTKEVF